jgi:hypothetical protein
MYSIRVRNIFRAINEFGGKVAAAHELLPYLRESLVELVSKCGECMLDAA